MQVFRFFTIIKFRAIYFSTSLGHYWPLIDKIGLNLPSPSLPASHLCHQEVNYDPATADLIFIRINIQFIQGQERWAQSLFLNLFILSASLLILRPYPQNISRGRYLPRVAEGRGFLLTSTPFILSGSLFTPRPYLQFNRGHHLPFR